MVIKDIIFLKKILIICNYLHLSFILNFLKESMFIFVDSVNFFIYCLYSMSKFQTLVPLIFLLVILVPIFLENFDFSILENFQFYFNPQFCIC